MPAAVLANCDSMKRTVPEFNNWPVKPCHKTVNLAGSKEKLDTCSGHGTRIEFYDAGWRVGVGAFGK